MNRDAYFHLGANAETSTPRDTPERLIASKNTKQALCPNQARSVGFAPGTSEIDES